MADKFFAKVFLMQIIMPIFFAHSTNTFQAQIIFAARLLSGKRY